MTREQIREGLTWGVATLLAALLCLSISPLVLLFAFVWRLGKKLGPNRQTAPPL